MERTVFGTSVRGASHIRLDQPCQDSSTIRNWEFSYRNKKNAKNKFYAQLDKQIQILSVADGHGSEKCPYSRTGSRIAVNVFCDIMAEFCCKYSNNMEVLHTYLNREADTRIAKAIDLEWKKRVMNHHTLLKRDKVVLPDGRINKDAIYELYGTTLLGIVITCEFIFAFQLGDGGIIYIDDNGLKMVLNTEKILGVETHSLSKKDAWKNVSTRIVSRRHEEHIPFMYFLTTDGMTNSFISEKEFHKSCSEYFEMIKKYGGKTVEENLSEWLTETSAMGCGDDISVLIAYYDE